MEYPADLLAGECALMRRDLATVVAQRNTARRQVRVLVAAIFGSAAVLVGTGVWAWLR